MLSMSIKELVRRVLPPSITIPLIALSNYRSGEPELKLLPELVDPAKNSIDIGANKGSYTYFLAQLSRQVFAYEPNPDLAALLKKGVRSNVEIYDLALSDQPGTATLAIPIVDTFAYDQLGSLNTQAEAASNMRTFEVPLGRLDDQGHTNVGFIKIDVEGHEAAVLDGATELIRQQRPVLMIEIEQKHHPDQDIATIFAKVLDLGYDGFFWLDGSLKSLNEFSPQTHQNLENYEGLASLGKTYICNFIFKPHAA